jgi:uncharacterized membrane protein
MLSFLSFVTGWTRAVFSFAEEIKVVAKKWQDVKRFTFSGIIM